MPIGGAYPCVPVSSVASPKSESLTAPSWPIRTFSGLRSACTQPAACRWARPSQIPAISRPPSASVNPAPVDQASVDLTSVDLTSVALASVDLASVTPAEVAPWPLAPAPIRSRRVQRARSMTRTIAPSSAGCPGEVSTNESISRTSRGWAAPRPSSTSRRAASATRAAWRGASPAVGMTLSATSSRAADPSPSAAGRPAYTVAQPPDPIGSATSQFPNR